MTVWSSTAPATAVGRPTSIVPRWSPPRPPRRELLEAAVADDIGAVGPYVAPVKLDRDGSARPGNLRERIRLAGPTIVLPAGAGQPVTAGM